jgi:hypothetical protein
MGSPGFTLIHVIISIVGIVSGLVVVGGLLSANRMPILTAIFLVFTILTSVTGFFFHDPHVTPGQIVGALSLVLLAIAVCAYYVFHLRGLWRLAYLGTAVASLYLNCFVLVAQSSLKVPQFHAAAPNGTEPPFVITQAIVLLTFVVLGLLSLGRFHPEAETP